MASAADKAPDRSIRQAGGPDLGFPACFKNSKTKLSYRPLFPLGLPSALLNALAYSFLFLLNLLIPNAAVSVTAVFMFCIRSALC
jgi:hypothetical protein